MAGVKIKGLEEFKRSLQKLEHKAEQIGGVRSVPLEEILTPTFLIRHTNFTSVEDLFQKSDYSIESPEDFDNIPQEDWDVFIAGNTLFSSWQDLLSTAMAEQVKLHFDS